MNRRPAFMALVPRRTLLSVVAVLAAVTFPAAVQVATASSSYASAGTASLLSGEVLHDGQSLVNGSFTFAMQTDGNFVLYTGSRALWQSHTAGRGGALVAMQTDGNLVVYDTANRPLWWSGTSGHAGAHLELQSDANGVVYSATGQPLWQTGTAGQGTAPSGFDSTRRAAAINWERAHAGNSAYNGLCELAVENAYSTSGHYGSARIDYNAQLSAGQVHHDPYAPAGALVFFNGDSSFGHVGIAVGDGATYWTTDGSIHIAPYSEGLGYLGWSYAPNTW